MDVRSSSSGLNRNERDAATALGAFFVGMLVLLCTTVLALYFLSGLPPIMVAGIFFAVLVFAVVCGAALMKTDPSPRRNGPPQLIFRAPAKRAQRPAQRPKPLR